MNRILIILALCLAAVSYNIAQKQKPIPLPKTYEAAWKQIDSLTQKGLFQSALTQTDALRDRARTEKNYPQLIKAIASRSGLINRLDPALWPAHIKELEAEVKRIPEPARSVLQSVLGDAYATYYQRNRYRIYNRSKTTEAAQAIDSTSIDTWDGPRIAGAANRAYRASIEQESVLKSTPLSAFSALIEPGSKEGEQLRPTLYDLLAHRAIRFFENTEFEIENKVFRFELDQPAYFADPAEFAKMPLRATGGAGTTGRLLALQTYQRLLAFHLQAADRNAAALVDADLGRLRFVRRYSTLPGKDSLYQQSLERQIVRWKNKPAEAAYAVELAQLWQEQGGAYNALSHPENKWVNKRAADLARDIVRRFPRTRAAQQAENLVNQLTAPSVSAAVEHVVVPDKPFLARVEYRNVPQVSYRLYRITPDERFTFGQLPNRNDEQRRALFARLLEKPMAAEGKTTLPDDGDLNSHAVEMPLNGLPLGHYVLLLSADGGFAASAKNLSTALLTASQLGFVSNNAYDGSTDRTIFVTDRISGQPLSGVQVQLFSAPQRYSQEPRYEPGDSRQTDANGRVTWPRTVLDPNRSVYFRISRGNDVVFTNNEYLYANQSQPESDHQQAILFTDRAIYRPGQPIYVKGVVYSGKDNNFSVVPNKDVELNLNDVNGENVSTIKLKTNEFGSFAGNFTAPVGRLTGDMTITCGYGQTTVRVEEYKRPTFAVKADTIRQAVRLGQSVRVSAKAQTFAGAAVDGASVRYRVTRTYVQPLWGWGGWGRSIWPPRPAQPTEVANGTTTTDATGAVSLSFAAAPDPTIERTGNPTFLFEVTFDVTDRAGETRTAVQTLQIGYSALQATLTIPEQVERGDAKTYVVKATNQSGVTVGVSRGEVVISRLQAPAQPLRRRIWERPDRQLLSQEEFKRLFPNDIYADEDNPEKWPRTNVLTAGPAAISLASLAPGEYLAEVSVTDAAGEKATKQQFFSVVDNRTASERPDSWVRLAKPEVMPGEEAIFFVGNRIPGWVLMTVDEENRPLRHEWIKTDGTPARVVIPITQQQEGGIHVTFSMVQQGRLLNETRTVTIPFADKQLTIETLTFRDKLKPGQADEWTIRISGPNKDRVAAEMVAALYDASLDEFVVHDWKTDLYAPYEQGRHNWNTGSFEQTQTNLLFYQWAAPVSVDAVNYPDLRIGSESPRYGRTEGAMAKLAAPMQASEMAMDSRQALNEVVTVGYGKPVAKAAVNQPQPVLFRKNFNETAFFFPQLRTDAEGRVLLTFTMPDALTRWKLLAFAHTKDMKTAALTREIVTQKELMVTLNPPRFLREGDVIQLSARIDNLTSKALTGTTRLDAFDAMTDQPISASVGLSVNPVSFSANAAGSAAASWTVTVPAGLPPVAFRVSATAGTFTDAEERVVPVLPNRMLVTDALPFWVNGQETRSFSLSELTGLTPGSPVQHERLTVEVTSNPVWTALQSLPYLMEYPYDGAEQVASRLYANYLAARIIRSRPEFRRVVDGWAAHPPKSPLMANEELKSVTLENSPWLAEAKSETERTARLGQLFDQNRLASEQRTAIDKLGQMQAANGGFSWFSGMEPDLTITLQVLANLGRIQAMSQASGGNQPAADLSAIQQKAVQFADGELKKWVADQKKQKRPSSSAYLPVQYLYARSLAAQAPALDEATAAYLIKHISKHWVDESLQGQALAVMGLVRTKYGKALDPNQRQTALAIVASLKDRAKQSDELGMYWPTNQPGTYWYQAPVETQAYLIEAFAATSQSRTDIQEMTKWLLRQKQTQAWPSTKATTEAINALFLGPFAAKEHALPLETGVTAVVKVGGQPLSARAGQENTSPLGYLKTTYNAAEIKPELGNVTIRKSSEGPSWGAMYWQHFEPLDKVKSGSTGLSVQKTLYGQRDTPNGPVIEPLSAKTGLKPGAIVKVRLVIKTDRRLDYVHLKDSRAAGFEPVATLSGYKFRNGLGYYEAPRDASTDFFMDVLPVGTHVFEYDLRVVQPGDFSAGVATIQCFYAPEFAAHSAGTRVKVN